MLPIVIPLPIPTGPFTSPERLERLERELGFCQKLLWVLVKGLKDQIAANDQSKLDHLLSEAGEAEVETLVRTLDTRVASGETELALRCMREETGAYWEDLYQIVAGWPNLSYDRKRSWLRFARLRKALPEFA